MEIVNFEEKEERQSTNKIVKRVREITTLHVFPNEKFAEPYIEFIDRNFNSKEHLFFIIGKSDQTKIQKRKNVIEINNVRDSLWMLVNEMNKDKKIILHGLFLQPIVFMLFFQPWLLKKCYWVVWGGDLYAYRKRNATLKNRVKELARKFVIKRFTGLITQIKGDYDLAKKWYGVEGHHYYSFIYPSNIYKEINVPDKIKDGQITFIQIGNSADPSNNHFEVFHRLKKLREENIRVIVPLSYGGDQEYVEKVEKLGREIFGAKFEPLLEFMPYKEYLKILAKIDVAIFNHDRQQAVGNICSLLSLGKKVYIRDNITTWRFFKDHGLVVYSVANEMANVLEPIPEEVKRNNREKMKKQFSEENLVCDWKRIFEIK